MRKRENGELRVLKRAEWSFGRGRGLCAVNHAMGVSQAPGPEIRRDQGSWFLQRLQVFA